MSEVKEYKCANCGSEACAQASRTYPEPRDWRANCEQRAKEIAQYKVVVATAKLERQAEQLATAQAEVENLRRQLAAVAPPRWLDLDEWHALLHDGSRELAVVHHAPTMVFWHAVGNTGWRQAATVAEAKAVAEKACGVKVENATPTAD